MTKPMKSQAKIRTVNQIASLAVAAALAPAQTPTPLCGPALVRRAATPRGGAARQSLSPRVRPHAALSGLIGGGQ